MVSLLEYPFFQAGDSLLPGFFPGGSTPVDFIVRDFAVIMIVAAIMLLITFKLKQPMVLGYLVAGIIIGPHTPPFSYVSDVNTLNLLAELGIIMLLFVVGTEFPITKLRALGRISIIVALVESLGTLVIVFLISRTLAFSFFDSLFLALAMSITSTVVTVRVLEELGMINDESSILLLGISIVEDIIAIAALGVLQSLAVAGGVAFLPNAVILISIVAAFIGITLFFGSKFLPAMIDRVGSTNDHALLLIVILGLAFGLSFIAKGLGLSVATGAFLAGVMVAESKSATISKAVTVPLRDMFAAIFFISMGALMDISLIPAFIVPAIIVILTSFASKLLIVTGLLTRAKYGHITSLRAGLGMSAAKGELSLVVVKGGQDVGAITAAIFPILGVVTIVTTFMAPYLLRFGSKLRSTANE